MNKLLMTMLMLCAGFFATQVEAKSVNDLRFFNYYWTIDDENLYFHVNLNQGLQFNNDYYTYGAKRCEIGCKALETCTLCSPSGFKLHGTTISVKISKESISNGFDYYIHAQSLCEDVNSSIPDDFYSYLQEIEGTVRVPLNQITEQPVFMTNDDSTEGIIVFPGVLVDQDGF